MRRLGLIEVVLPVETIHYREASSGTSVDETGLGDAELHLHGGFRFGGWWLVDGAGIVVPTGKTLASPFAGVTHPAVVEPGSGAYELSEFGCIGRLPTAITAASICAGTTGFRLATARRTRRASTDVSLVGSQPLMCRHVLVTAELGYEVDSGVLDGSTQVEGHDEVFAGASVWAVLYRGVAIRATVRAPLYERRYGAMQLGDTVRVMGALSYDFDR